MIDSVFVGFPRLGDSEYPNNDVKLSMLKGNDNWQPPHAVAFDCITCPLCTCAKGINKKISVLGIFGLQTKIEKSGIIPMWHMAVY